MSSLVEVIAARGGLDGGDGRPEIGTSGIPLGPCSPGSAVVEALQRGRRVDEVATGEDINLTGYCLAVVTTTTTVIIVFHWRHFCRSNPGLLIESRNLSRSVLSDESSISENSETKAMLGFVIVLTIRKSRQCLFGELMNLLEFLERSSGL